MDTNTPDPGSSDGIVCHMLDARGRPMCGAARTGVRRNHSYALCVLKEHARCATCESLADLVDAAEAARRHELVP
jgi:hypothetical protein